MRNPVPCDRDNCMLRSSEKNLKITLDHAGSRWITLVEAAERILPAVPPRVSEGAANLLRKLGIDVRTQARVVEVQPRGGSGLPMATSSPPSSIPSELVVWAAGVKGPE